MENQYACYAGIKGNNMMKNGENVLLSNKARTIILKAFNTWKNHKGGDNFWKKHQKLSKIFGVTHE